MLEMGDSKVLGGENVGSVSRYSEWLEVSC